MSTLILQDREAREKFFKGMNIVADAVGSTLGARGRNVTIDRTVAGRPENIITVHDGVTVAKAIDLSDPFENAGVRIIRQAAQKQVDMVGDGTTATIVLAQALINEADKLMAAGVDPMSLRPGLEETAQRVASLLQQSAKPITNLKEAVQVATISAEDAELGKMIGETVYKVGVEGVVTVEESKASETVVEHQEGMQFDKGYASSYFATNPETMEATLRDPYILVTDYNLDSMAAFQELVPFLNEKLGKDSKTLVVIAPEIANEALASFVMNKVQGVFNFLCINAPLYGEKQSLFLQDIAILSGGKFISSKAGYKLGDLELTDLGKADSVTSDKDATVIVGGKGESTKIKERVNAIKAQLETEESEFEREKLKERLAKLTSGVSVIRVGGNTEIEMLERKERAIDAVAATQAALRSGVVPGGETAYLRVASQIECKDAGSTLLYNALKRPIQKLLTNAGVEPGEVIAKLRDDLKVEDGWLYDVVANEYKLYDKVGIIDPVEVPIQAIKNAVSVAIQAMTTNFVIVNKPKEDK